MAEEGGNKIRLDEGLMKKGGVNQGVPVSQRPADPKGQGTSQNNSNKGSSNSGS